MEILIIVLIVFYIVIFYFLKMRPEKQRKKEMEAMKRSLAPGDAVTMIDGHCWKYLCRERKDDCH